MSGKVKDKSHSINLDKEPQRLNNLRIGMNEESFLLLFNCDENNSAEYTVSIPSLKFKQLLDILYDSGLNYQEQYNENIGFVEEEGE